ncbi:MAG: TIGR02594 family protein, partial [Culicoidibacterales bacterium]
MNVKNFAFLKTEQLPKILKTAYDLIGTKEKLGSENNPIIMDWAKKLGLAKTYNADSVPWCGLFVAYCVSSAGFEVVKNPLWARNWASFGVKQKQAMLGDVLTFIRDGGGHVGIYVGENRTGYFVLGGNQGDT